MKSQKPKKGCQLKIHIARRSRRQMLLLRNGNSPLAHMAALNLHCLAPLKTTTIRLHVSALSAPITRIISA
jgi:hypothetical protein